MKKDLLLNSSGANPDLISRHLLPVCVLFASRCRVWGILLVLLTVFSGNAFGACDETGLTASPGVFVLDFYNCSQLSSTSGTSLTTANCRTHTIVPTGITTSDVITGVTNSNNSYVRYDMNGGLTLGYGTTAKIQTTLSIGSNFPVRKITVVGAAYDSSVPLYVAGTSVTLNSKGTQYTSCSNSTTITPSPYITSIVIKQNNGSNKKRSTLYTAVCEYGYRAYLTAPGTGSISATPKTANENGAGWNGTENAVVGLKSGQKVTLSATPPSGYTVGSWTVKKKSDNSDITASVLSGTTLTMPAYDVTVSVTWEAAASCDDDPTVTAASNNGSFS
jgi:hypothetical protein